MKIFLDDNRIPKDCISYMEQRIGNDVFLYLQNWRVVKNYTEFCTALIEGFDGFTQRITHVSFDHDLADEHYHPSMFEEKYTNDIGEVFHPYNECYNYFKEKTGYDCAKWMKEYYEINGWDLPIIFVHSMNPIGTENINKIFKLKK